MGNPDCLDGLRAWLRRWRPCRPQETAGGHTAPVLWEIVQQRDLAIAKHEETIAALRAQVDTAVRRIDNLDDLRRDIRALADREGV